MGTQTSEVAWIHALSRRIAAPVGAPWGRTGGERGAPPAEAAWSRSPSPATVGGKKWHVQERKTCTRKSAEIARTVRLFENLHPL